MGNTTSSFLRDNLSLILRPHPSEAALLAATRTPSPPPSPPLQRSEIIILHIVDKQDSDKTTIFFIKRTMTLFSVRAVFAQQKGYPATQLEMRVFGRRVFPTDTAEKLGLRDGTCVETSRRPIVDLEQGSAWVDRRGSERVEDEERMRALVWERFSRKARIARETFGWE